MKAAKIGMTSATLEARIVRKDGRIEELGVISYWHKNPLRRLHWRISQWLRRKTAGRIS